MYAIVEDNKIKQIITNPKSVVIGDVRYPAKIFQLWSKSEKEAIGIYEIVIDQTNYKDPEYYVNTNEQHNFADGQVTKSWGTATPKLLEDRNETNEDGSPMLDADGNQVVTKGLKSQKKQIIKNQASGLLAPTDWHVIKATEVTDYSVPANVTTFRSDVRAKSNEMETQIDACTTVDELKNLYTRDENGIRPLAEFPKEVV